MHITFSLVTLCACATSYNYPCACAIKGASFVHRVVCLISLSLLIRFNSLCVLIVIIIFFMAAFDKCSFDHFLDLVIAEFHNNDAKSLAFFRSHSVLSSEIICPHSFLTVITARIRVFGAVGSLVLFLNLRKKKKPQ